MELFTIFKAFNAADAQLIRSRLEAAGFHPFVADELSNLNMQGFWEDGIRVQVPEDEAASAKEFLDAPGDAEEPIQLK